MDIFKEVYDGLLLGGSLFFSSWLTVLLFIMGIVGGLVFGAVPGLSGVILIALVTPFTIFLSAPDAIMLLGVIYSIGIFGGAITAILFNIPGSPENAPTCFDGYPMTQQGKAGKAIGAAIIASALGGVLSIIVMMFASTFVADIALNYFGRPEVFAIIFLGMCLIASVASESQWKGWVSLLLGMLIASVGTEPTSGYPRFAFGMDALRAGINFVPVIMGFFAVSQLFIFTENIIKGAQKTYVKPEMLNMHELWSNKGNILRSWGIGFFAGIVPGIGAILASFMSYSQALRFAGKRKKYFGKGALEGVIASETANNTSVGAAMIPMLALGIPGSAITAIMIGAFRLHGMDPGPLVMATAKELVWLTFVAMLLANVCILFAGYFLTKIIVMLLRIPLATLTPIIFVFAAIGIYSMRFSVLDLWTMMIAGVFAYLLRKANYSMAAIVMGIILGQMGEANFSTTMQIFNYNPMKFIEHPIALVMIMIGVIIAVLGAIQRKPLVKAGG